MTLRRMPSALSCIALIGLSLWGLTALAGPLDGDRGDDVRESMNRREIKARAHDLDRLVESEVARRGLKPGSRVDDQTWVRRAYLTIAGRIPNEQETTDFLRQHGSDKDGQLIDSLLASDGHVSHMFHFWADLFRAKTRLARRVSGEPYMHWLKESVADNKPYDDFVRELVTSDGAAHAEDNGATGYYLRDQGMPLDNMSNTVRVFLGTRLECAQCHDHPFDRWTQLDFYQMAAFTGGISYRDTSPAEMTTGMSQGYRGLFRGERDRDVARAYRRVVQPISAGVSGSGSGLIRLPKDYQYDNAKPQEPVVAKPLFGPEVALDVTAPRAEPRKRFGRRRANRRNRQQDRFPEVGSREVFADWLVSPDNPRFTTVISNRMWKLVMGQGLIEPVDQMTDDSASSNPALMSALESLMRTVDYDLKEFLRVVLNMKTFRREAALQEDEIVAVTGPAMRRMSAEQVWDSMLTLVLPNVDETLDTQGQKAQLVYDRYNEVANLSADELRDEVRAYAVRYKDPQQFRANQRKKAMEQRAARTKAQSSGREQLKSLTRQLRLARRNKDRAKVADLTAQIERLRGQAGRRRGGNRSGLARASELPSPAPAGHFLRQFGQSDREQIQANHTDATVPQVLNLLNGFVEKEILSRPYSHLMTTLANATSTQKKIQAAFMSILNRKPTQKELSLFKKYWSEDEDVAVADMVWTLLNTHEFMFIR